MGKQTYKETVIYMMVFICTVFYLATCMPSKAITLFDWIVIVVLNTVIELLLLVIWRTDVNYNIFAKCTFSIYIIYIISSKINAMFRYMKIYHGFDSAYSTLVCTGILIYIFVVYSDMEINRFIKPFFILSMLMITVSILINIEKVSRYNLMHHNIRNSIDNPYCVTMFDCIFPVTILLNNGGYNNRKKSIFYVCLINLAIFSIILFTFSCYRGNYLYSISPLQAVFQLSYADLIRNFDGFFNFLLFFQYIAVILTNIWVFSVINRKNEKIKYIFLLLVPFSVYDFSNINILTEFAFVLVCTLMFHIGKDKNEKV